MKTVSELLAERADLLAQSILHPEEAYEIRQRLTNPALASPITVLAIAICELVEERLAAIETRLAALESNRARR